MNQPFVLSLLFSFDLIADLSRNMTSLWDNEVVTGYDDSLHSGKRLKARSIAHSKWLQLTTKRRLYMFLDLR